MKQRYRGRRTQPTGLVLCTGYFPRLSQKLCGFSTCFQIASYSHRACPSVSTQFQRVMKSCFVSAREMEEMLQYSWKSKRRPVPTADIARAGKRAHLQT